MKLLSLLLTVAVCLSLPSCTKKEASDPRVDQLQNEVAKLSGKNKKLQSDVLELQQKIEELEVRAATPVPVSTAQSQARIPMTAERMKAEVAPVLEAEIRKIKLASDTPRKGSAYGMRVEYDTKHAVYGLNQSKDRKTYAARVVVKYEKILESETDSRTYDTGSQEFRFAYKNGKWVLEK